MKEKMIDGHWRGLHYRFMDSRSETGVLLLHPIALHIGWISKTANLFNQQGFKVWLLDLPAHGQSRKQRIGIPILKRIPVLGKCFWAADFELADTAKTVVEFAQHIRKVSKVQRLVGGGFSFGGLVLGFALAQDQWRAFDSAFVQCYGARKEDVRAYENTPLMINFTRLLVWIFGIAPVIFFIKMSVPIARYFSNIKLSLKELKWVLKTWFPDPDAALMFSRKTLFSLHFAPHFDDSPIPILLLAPELDAIFTRYADKLTQRLSNASIYKITGARHSIFVDGTQDEMKSEIVRHIASWLEQSKT